MLDFGGFPPPPPGPGRVPPPDVVPDMTQAVMVESNNSSKKSGDINNLFSILLNQYFLCYDMIRRIYINNINS